MEFVNLIDTLYFVLLKDRKRYLKFQMSAITLHGVVNCVVGDEV